MIGVGLSLTTANTPAAEDAPEPLSVVAAPSTLTWGAGSSYDFETGECTATATGGTGPYTYTWNAVSGSIGEAMEVDGARVVIFGGDTNDPAVMQCEVTDATMATALSNTVSIS